MIIVVLLKLCLWEHLKIKFQKDNICKETNCSVKKSSRQTEFFRKGIIEYANEDNITLPVDNRSGTKEEINTTKIKFENCI